MSRPTIPQTMIEVAKVLSRRATCDRLHAGSVIFDDRGRIISTGYNGAPTGMAHCDDVGHLMVENHCKRTVHAERNAVIFAGERARGMNLANHPGQPCIDCVTTIIQAGIYRVYCERGDYDNLGAPAQIVREQLIRAGVKLMRVDPS